TQYVRMRIAEALVDPNSAGVKIHPAGIEIDGLELLDHTSPEHAGGTEFSDLEEVGGSNAEDELDLARGEVNAAGFAEYGQLLNTLSDGNAELLNAVSAGF